MNKYIFLFVFGSLLFSQSALAQMKNYTNVAKSSKQISVTGYMNYPLLGYIQTIYNQIGKKNEYYYRSVFEGVIQDLKQKSNTDITYNFDINSNDESFLAKINNGKIDIFLGSYYDTKIFQRLEPIYPSILNNPVIIITMPETSKKIQNISQLKQMKGAFCKQDKFSDYVQRSMKEYPLIEVDTPIQMFEKLYTGEVDFIFTTQYFGLIEAIKLGLRDYLSFSKQIVWNMPVFIGVSRLSPNRKFLVQKLSSYSENPEHKKKIEQKLQDIIHEFELEYRGVVPPAFIKTENNNNPTSTLDLLPQEDKI